jgi:hypothetical protein
VKIKWMVCSFTAVALLVIVTLHERPSEAAAFPSLPAVTYTVITEVGSQVDSSDIGIAESGVYWLGVYAQHLARIGQELDPEMVAPTRFAAFIIDVSQKLGPQAADAIERMDQILPIVSVVITLARLGYAGEAAKKQGYGFSAGVVDNMISQGGWWLAPGYIQTDKTVSTALKNLSQDPSLEGSYLSSQATQATQPTTANSAGQNDPVKARRRQMAEDEGKQLYGPSYKLPANYDDN